MATTDTTDGSRFALLEIDDDLPAPRVPAPAPTAPLVEAPKRCTRCNVPGPLTTEGLCPVCVKLAAPREVTSSVTPQRVAMSPRMERIYGWINAHGCTLTPFSTDTTVAGMLPRLRTLRAELANVNAPSTNPHSADMLADLDAIMRRVPSARVDNPVVDPVPTEETQLGKKARVQAADLVAVSGALESTGTLTYWSLSGALDVGKLTTAWEAETLDADDLPEVPSAKVALHRACKAQSSKTVLLRQHSEGGWTLTDLAGKVDPAKVAEGATLDKIVETNGVRVRLSEEDEQGNVRVLLTPPGGKDAPEDVKEAARVLGAKIRAAFDESRTEIAADDVGVWLVGTVARLGGVALRESGGFYFVPKATTETLAKVSRALKTASGTAHKVYEIPVMHGSGTVEAVLDSLRAELTKFLADVANELNHPDGMGHRAARNRTTELETFREKLKGYEKLLGVELGAEAPLKALGERLAKVHGNRFNNLEVD